MTTHIRPARIEQFDAIVALIGEVVCQMNQVGNYQWNEHYPPADLILSDLKAGNLFVAMPVDSPKVVAGIVCIDQQAAEEYRGIAWQIPLEASCYIHRLGVLPQYQQQQIGQQLLDFADRFAVDIAKKALKLDTYEHNKAAERLFLACGYNYVGDIAYANYDGRYRCYEKKLIY